MNTSELDDLRQRVQAIEQRNVEVDQNKGWETSLTRKVFIALFTYAFVVGYGFVIEADRPFLTAIVPVAGFLLSGFTIPIAKRAWIKRHS